MTLGGTKSVFKVGGTFHARCYARAHWSRRALHRFRTEVLGHSCEEPLGRLKWEDDAKNIIPNAALNDVLGVYFGATAQTTTFYMGMVDNAGFTSLTNATDTMASHTGWSENNNYSAYSTRPTWTPGSASGQSISNGTATQFTINANSQTIKGFFLTSSSAGSPGTAGMLVATAALGTPQSCNSGDVLKVTYSINATTS